MREFKWKHWRAVPSSAKERPESVVLLDDDMPRVVLSRVVRTTDIERTNEYGHTIWEKKAKTTWKVKTLLPKDETPEPTLKLVFDRVEELGEPALKAVMSIILAFIAVDMGRDLEADRVVD